MQAILTIQASTLEEQGKEIVHLREWQRLEIASRKAAKEAVEEYIRFNGRAQSAKDEPTITMKMMTNIGVALAIIAALVTAVLTGKGAL